MKRHTFRDWYQVHNPRSWHLFRVRMAYRELGWKYFGFRPWRMFKATGFIPELWYYLKCRLWKQYNVVRVRSLPPTWVDRDNLLLHAAFEILRDVVEQEDWLNHTVYFLPVTEHDPYGADYRDDWQEIATLYDWWINRRPARLALEDHVLTCWGNEYRKAGNSNIPSSELLSQLEVAGEAEDEDMLVRLCRIRKVLWT
jgi:hypothetical protein